MSIDKHLQIGRETLLQESQALQVCAEALGESFSAAVEAILKCTGRVATCGLGKSGHIARKTSGTFSSTGTPSFFLHASEAFHGDLGMVTADDIVLLYSQSGETDEIVRLFPFLREIGAKTILISGRGNSSSALFADLVLLTGVTKEACPLNLAPTTSTTVMLALSDALAVTVMEQRGFNREDFSKFHPSGALGRRLYLKVSDVMRPLPDIAVLLPGASGLEVVQQMTTHGVGAACVVHDGKLLGLISEGDLRRHLTSDLGAQSAEGMMNGGPAIIEPDLLAIEAVEVFQNFPVKIGELPVVGPDGFVGLLVLKDLVRSGIL